ncbi:class I SAM-dependent methyltransferase [Paralimibaculum aggregatum]|uniref:Class I SAM-dependent methyltransferase n=1 Tax=Paralimibaculum aggregatum TaxID=3036245 RepID=A0ABQ6LQ15_9RHOB|nr:class I SAM-dependent methyltransferase [Limibaculum sp. NKW23]GMG84714.1 class I SAM-dependent methyltransferase [Limibaculum sp. NKW23]
MPLNTEDLEHVYGARTPEEARAAYDGWAERYDGDNLAGGFRLPGVAAGFAARHVPRGSGPILDAGCGTGLVGEALTVFGFGPLHGLDLSPRMLAAAEARGVYESLTEHRLGTPLPFADGAFRAASCFGSFGPGHAPPESLDELARVVRPGGHVLFNLVEASYEAQGFPAVMERLAAAGRWREAERSPAFRAFLLTEPELLCRVFVFEVLT